MNGPNFLGIDYAETGTSDELTLLIVANDLGHVGVTENPSSVRYCYGVLSRKGHIFVGSAMAGQRRPTTPKFSGTIDSQQ